MLFYLLFGLFYAGFHRGNLGLEALYLVVLLLLFDFDTSLSIFRVLQRYLLMFQPFGISNADVNV